VLLAALAVVATVVARADESASLVVRADRELDHWRTEEARKLVAELGEAVGKEAAATAAHGRLLGQDGKLPDAIDALATAARLDPANVRILLWLGEAQLLAKKSSDAKSTFKKALELATTAAKADPKSAERLFLLGVAEARSQKFDQAVADLGRSRDLDPKSAETWYELGRTSLYRKKYQDAVDALDQAVSIDAGIPHAYYYRGIAWDKLGKKEKLINDFERFLKLAPNAPEAAFAKSVVAAGGR